MSSFYQKYYKQVELAESLVCVGLDSAISKLPSSFLEKTDPQFAFNQWIIDQTFDLACAYKLNTAFYEELGSKGWIQLEKSIQYLKKNYPDIPIILDCKRADIGNTNEAYAKAFFDYLDVDAVTLHPYLGLESLKPFLQRVDKGCIILCKTSDKSSSRFQDLQLANDMSLQLADNMSSQLADNVSLQLTENANLQPTDNVNVQLADNMTLWEKIMDEVNANLKRYPNLMLVMSANHPVHLQKARKKLPEMIFLVPGVGAQQADLESVLESGLDKNKKGLIINSSRQIIFSDNPRLATIELRDKINEAILN